MAPDLPREAARALEEVLAGEVAVRVGWEVTNLELALVVIVSAPIAGLGCLIR